MIENKKSPAPSKPESSDLTEPTSSKEEVSAFLNKVRTMTKGREEGDRGRLIFAMDATMSRQPAWDLALGLQAEMFHEVKQVGGLDVQLVYFRGFRECRASRWVSDPDTLANLMSQVSCRGGHTQIARVLKHAIGETSEKKVSALVYVGDCMEEDIDDLSALAGELGLLGVSVFVFQEGYEPGAERAFREIAKLSRGVYCRFDAGSAQQLKELLSAVAVYAAGGQKALENFSRDRGANIKALIEQLS